MTIAPVLMVAGVLVGGAPLLVLPSSSAAVTPEPTAVTLGTSSMIEIDTVEVAVLPRPSVTVKVKTSRAGSVLGPLLASGVVSNGEVSV